MRWPIGSDSPIPDLFRLLSAKIDGAGPAGFDGTICVGVRTPEGTSWWHAVCARQKATRILASRVEADVLVGFDEQSAQWALGAVPKPGPVRLVTGDVRVWQRFVRRYFGGTSSLLGLRVAEAKK